MISYIGKIFISLAVFEIDHLEYALSFLEQNVGLFVLIFLDEFVCNISKLEQKQRDLILVDLDLLVVELVERVILLGGCGLFFCLFWLLFDFGAVNRGSFLHCRLIFERIYSSFGRINLFRCNVLERGTRLSRF